MITITDRPESLGPHLLHPNSHGAEPSPRIALATDLLICLLLSLLQILWAGYRLGVGNQSIQIPFLQHLIDPSLFTRDRMVDQTLRDYPSVFFAALASVLPVTGIAKAYFVLHLLGGFAVFAGMTALSRAIFRDRWAGLMVLLLLLAGHHRALAGDDLYSTGFTHTWAVFPLAIFALALLYRDRYVLAFLLTGLIFNLHALTAAYLLAMLGICAAWEQWADRKRLGWLKLAALFTLFAFAAAPTIDQMVRHPQRFDANWVRLTTIRSADHSFPSSWWQTGDSSIPKFLALIGLAALSLSFTAPSRQQRKSILLTSAVGLLFIAGYALADLHPVATILRAQLFRASRLLLVIAFAHIAHGLVQSWRPAKDLLQPRWHLILERVSVVVTLGCLVDPPLLPFLPIALLLATITALINNRLAWWQSFIASTALLVCLIASTAIGFAIPGLGGMPLSLHILSAPIFDAPDAFRVALPLMAVTIIALLRHDARRFRIGALVAGLGIYFSFAIFAYAHFANADPSRDGWVAAQLWAQQNTPKNALFLTPAYPGGFRVYSSRAVVGEWRDGTQAYFNAQFAGDWWDRMTALQPGVLTNSRGDKLLSRGKPLEEFDDADVIALCKRFDADYVVLPTAKEHNLVAVSTNPQWSIYKPIIAPPKPPPSLSRPDPVFASSHPLIKSAVDSLNRFLQWTYRIAPENAESKFMRETVYPNIDQYRKSDAKIEIVDTKGKPVANLPFEVHETRQAFHFSCSLWFFQRPAPVTYTDWKPPVVTQTELDRFDDLFNSSLIPFSGKWAYIEGIRGQRNYTDLDQYVNWCEEHRAAMEFHFLSGYEPMWWYQATAAVQKASFLNHVKEMMTRYGKDIDFWQVTNERHSIEYAPEAFAAARAIEPNAKLGISDCAEFWYPGVSKLRGEPLLYSPIYKGLADLRWLKSLGVKVDFFGFHGHRPFGLWPDPAQMYDILDTFAKEGVKIHISEFGGPMDHEIIGPTHRGQWTPELQARFYCWFYTVCFSHPEVDFINIWGMGPVTWLSGTGILDEKGKPKPVYERLRKLLREEWMTNLRGTLAAESPLAFRGFHGDYEITVMLPSGKKATATFAITPNKTTHLRLHLDAERGTLAVQ